jgi:hypothetical protein
VPGLSHLLCLAGGEGLKSDRQQSSGSLHHLKRVRNQVEFARADARSYPCPQHRRSTNPRPFTTLERWLPGVAARLLGERLSVLLNTRWKRSPPRDSTESTKALSLRVLEYYALPLLTRFRSHSTLAPALMLRPPVVRGALNERRGWH